jgi:hypothetical protein
MGPPAVDLSVPPLARLAFGARHRQPRNCCGLASRRLSPVLDLEGAARPTRVLPAHPADRVSGNYFATLKTPPAKGRFLGENDDRLDTSPVAVISYGSWERHFGLDPNVVGRKITVNGMPVQIAGVTARGFFGAQIATAPEFWLVIEQNTVQL